MFLEWENNSGKLQISGAFQNNAINDVKQISLRHVIIYLVSLVTRLLVNFGSKYVKLPPREWPKGGRGAAK